MKQLFGAIAICTALAATPTAQAGQLTDATIFAIFDQANMADITTARLGLKKAQSAEVKELAGMVLADHEAVQLMGRDLAKKLGVIPLPPDDDGSLAAQAKAYGELQGKSGAEFDRAYLKHEVAFHQSVIDAIKGTLLPAASHPELKALIVKVLPGFEHHLAVTTAAATKLAAK